MKNKYFFPLLFLIFTSNVLHGQAAILALIFGDKVASEKFNLSMEIGGNFTRYSNLENFDGSRLGINFGISGNIKFSEHFYISPSIFFLGNRNIKFKNLSLQTSSSSLNENYSNVDAELNMNYYDVPILFSYLNKKGTLKYSLGPQISFLQSSNMVYLGEQGEFTENFKYNTKSNDFGVVADFAYIYKNFNGSKDVHIHARYYYGTQDVFKSNFNSAKNRSSYFSVVLSFPFVKKEKEIK
jgi:hypothetical protein